MTVYLAFLTVVIMIGWYLYGDKITTAQRRDYLLLSGVALLVLMTLRYSIGFDYFSYNNIFETVKAMSFGEVLTQHTLELGFYLLCKVVTLFGSYHVFLLICNIIMLGCVFWVIYRYSSMWWMSVSLYVTVQFMAHSMNLLRQSIAASIAFAGWGYLKAGKFWKYCLVILLASTFHISALVMIPAYFLLRLPFNTKLLAAFGAVTLLVYFSFRPLLLLGQKILPIYFDTYIGSMYDNQNSPIYLLFPFIYCFLALCFSSKLLQRGREAGEEKKYSILLYSALFTMIIYLFITKMFIVERLSIYIFMYAMLLVPEMLMLWQPKEEGGKKKIAATEGQKAPKQRLAMLNNKAKLRYHLAIAGAILISLGYLSFASWDGFHKAYPYVGIWEMNSAMSNQEYSEIRLERIKGR